MIFLELYTKRRLTWQWAVLSAGCVFALCDDQSGTLGWRDDRQLGYPGMGTTASDVCAVEPVCCGASDVKEDCCVSKGHQLRAGSEHDGGAVRLALPFVDWEDIVERPPKRAQCRPWRVALPLRGLSASRRPRIGSSPASRLLRLSLLPAAAPSRGILGRRCLWQTRAHGDFRLRARTTSY